MQRPTRIVVFGVLCLLVGFFALIKNGVDLGASIGGPSLIAWMQSVSENQPTPAVLKESNELTYTVMRAALSKPVYRVGLGIKSAVGLGMACLLAVAGIGLLMNRLWSIRLTRVWGFYALVAGAYTVVMDARYVTPENTAVSPGSGLLAAACSLPLLWLFPVLLLTMLGRPVVREYMAWRASARQGPTTTAPATGQTTHRPAPRPMAGPPQDRPDAARPAEPDRPAPPPPRPEHQTWRDDPWNDPGSR